jgi:hypothetical protein
MPQSQEPEDPLSPPIISQEQSEPQPQPLLLPPGLLSDPVFIMFEPVIMPELVIIPVPAVPAAQLEFDAPPTHESGEAAKTPAGITSAIRRRTTNSFDMK